MAQDRPVRPEVVAFDIIGTTFPLAPLRPLLTALGLPPAALEAWFAAGLRDAFALSATGNFRPLTEVLSGGLDQLLAQEGLSASHGEKSAVLEAMGRLPPRPDAREAFETITAAGMRVLALSNGAADATRALLRAGGLEHLVGPVVSVEEVRLFKPRREVYEHAARIAGVPAGRMALVAVHSWDIQGAGAAGLSTAYVSAEQPFSTVMRRPDLETPTLAAAARALIAL
ncbi:HAD-IA family hydrolase [Roseomonas elaeocarpi]|uniref:HAD-IA family hydrolase n=1 Tax=Roseomonas elaeocarpi TaxID=907779 RepID=A0ABV6JY52_9PROT